MDGPEVLVSHYSSLAFYTRLAALTFVGAIIGAVHEHLKEDERCVVGVGILLVIAALAEFNRRYTLAYVAAVYAASCADTHSSTQDKAVARWQYFQKFNSMTTPGKVRWRMLCSWLTYLPGFVLGEYLLFTRHALDSGLIAVSLGVAVAAWLGVVAFLPYPRNDEAAKTGRVPPKRRMPFKTNLLANCRSSRALMGEALALAPRWIVRAYLFAAAGRVPFPLSR